MIFAGIEVNGKVMGIFFRYTNIRGWRFICPVLGDFERHLVVRCETLGHLPIPDQPTYTYVYTHIIYIYGNIMGS